MTKVVLGTKGWVFDRCCSFCGVFPACSFCSNHHLLEHYSSMAGSSQLSGIFGNNGGGTDVSLTYTAPKQPMQMPGSAAAPRPETSGGQGGLLRNVQVSGFKLCVSSVSCRLTGGVPSHACPVDLL